MSNFSALVLASSLLALSSLGASEGTRASDALPDEQLGESASAQASAAAPSEGADQCLRFSEEEEQHFEADEAGVFLKDEAGNLIECDPASPVWDPVVAGDAFLPALAAPFSLGTGLALGGFAAAGLTLGGTDSPG